VEPLPASTTDGRKPGVVYFGLYDPREYPGVHQKVTGLLRAASRAGFETRVWVEPFRKTAPLARLSKAIDAAPETHLILRSIGFANFFLIPALWRARRRGCHVTIEVGAPNWIAVREIWTSPQSLWRRARAVVAFYVSGPWSLWPATRIVQYAPESWWFRLGNSARTVEVGNGIDVAAVEPRASAPSWPAPVLKLVAVATVSKWHGYDRLLRAIKEHSDRPARAFDVHLTIAGQGPALDGLRALSASLGLDDRIAFAGTVTGAPLRALYEQSHLAVSSLALHRIGLSTASVLKAREYCAIGIPFIATGHDPDFPAGLDFRLVVSAGEDTGDIIAAFDAFASAAPRIDAAAMRRYAMEHLDFQHKLDAFGVRG
jgi:glycosyltransferase involved in cell wall biosynthesis